MTDNHLHIAVLACNISVLLLVLRLTSAANKIRLDILSLHNLLAKSGSRTVETALNERLIDLQRMRFTSYPLGRDSK